MWFLRVLPVARRSRGVVGFGAVLWGALAVGIDAAEFKIRWAGDQPESAHVVVEGLSAGELNRLKNADWSRSEWQKLLSVHAEPKLEIGALIDLPAMVGKYEVEPDAVRFTPQFPLERGLTYRAVFRPTEIPGGGKNGSSISASVKLPAKILEPSTTVEAVYPSGSEVPENLLKFYLHFSAPMSRGGIYEYILLENAEGQPIELPFLEIDEELWNREMTRLTLFIDPGRIKRGVLPLEEIGPALEAGKSFKLVIDRRWQDAEGAPLKSGFEKTFSVVAPDRTPPNPQSWKIGGPSAGTKENLKVRFPEPMEHALALRLIWVADEAEKPLNGKARLEEAERVWVFEPSDEWRRGKYYLAVQNTIEDLAGNNIGKPFEVDLFEEVKRLTPEVIRLPLEVK